MSHGLGDLSAKDAEVVYTIVVAGGSGARFGARKQFASLGGISVLAFATTVAATSTDGVVVVVPVDSVDDVEMEMAIHENVDVVAGGDSRAGSVRAGLAAVPETATIVLVHDAARPLASVDLYQRVIGGVRDGAAAVIPVVAVTDSIRHVDGHPVDRAQLRAVQTPQGFRARTLREAHGRGEDATDDATLVSALGYEVVTVGGEPENAKLTVPSDLAAANAVLAARRFGVTEES